MLLDKYIFKELFKSQLVVLLVLLSIFVGQGIVRLMSESVVSGLPPRLIGLFLLYSLPDFLVYLMPLTLYVAIIITLGRICSDSEMVVMRAVGYSPMRIMLVTILLGIVTSAAVGYVSSVLTYQAANARNSLELQAANDPEFLPIESGRFVEFGMYNVYVEHVDNKGSNNKDISNIYVIETDYNGMFRPTITAAKEGHISIDPEGTRWLELKDGRRYESDLEGNFRQGHFSVFRAPVSSNVTEASNNKNKIGRTSTLELINNANTVQERLEIQWRLAPIFSTLVLCIVAVPLSMVNPRQGRFARLMPAILIYAAYYLFLMSVRNFINTGVFGIFPGLYIVPLLFLFLVAIPLNLPKSHIKHIRHTKKMSQAKSEH